MRQFEGAGGQSGAKSRKYWVLGSKENGGERDLPGNEEKEE